MVTLLDVNVLIALGWANHQHHDAAHHWFASQRSSPWATCPLTQVAFVRISANPRIVDATVPAAIAAGVLRKMTQHPEHHFWAEYPNVAELKGWPPGWVQGHRQVTDAYLLATAEQHKGKLVTFDRKLAMAAETDSLELLTVVVLR